MTDRERVSIRITAVDKQNLIKLAKSKGCDKLTDFLRLLARARDVSIKT